MAAATAAAAAAAPEAADDAPGERTHLPSGTRSRRVTLVVILTLREGALEDFRAFETHAAKVMAKHGGSIERSVVIPPPHPGAPMREVHVVTFPDAASFAAYRADDALVPLAPLRARAIVSTEILVGEEGPDYGALARASSD